MHHFHSSPWLRRDSGVKPELGKTLPFCKVLPSSNSATTRLRLGGIATKRENTNNLKNDYSERHNLESEDEEERK